MPSLTVIVLICVPPDSSSFVTRDLQYYSSGTALYTPKSEWGQHQQRGERFGSREVCGASDLRVIDALRQGDEDTFRRLVDKYQASLGRVARLYVSNRAVADDVVQDTWMGVIQGIGA